MQKGNFVDTHVTEAVNRRTDDAMTKHKRFLRNILQLQRTI